MTKINAKNTLQLNIIAYYQIIGGVYGLYSILSILIKEPTVSGLGLIIYLIIIGLYLFSIYCGNLVRLQKVRGLVSTKWSQITQLFQFNILGIAFWYISGIGISVGYGKTDDIMQFMYLNFSSMYFKYNLNETGDFYFYLNITPIVVLYFTEKLERKIKNEQAISISS
jgi:hypothetical protein